MRRALVLVLLVACKHAPSSGDGKAAGVTVDAAPACDLSTDDAARAKYKELTGQEMDKDHACIDRPPDFPRVVRLGSFAYDRGCEWEQTLVDCKPGATEPQILASAGWAKADGEARKKIAVNYLAELGSGGPVESDDGTFKAEGKTFAPPEITASPDGSVVIKAWYSHGGGMSPEVTYTLAETTFAPDGTMSGKRLDQFTHRFR